MRRPIKAYTLIEIVITMSTSVSMLVMAVGIVHQTMFLASQSQRRSNQDRAIGRLVDQFRHDVHRAADCGVSVSGNFQLTAADSQLITYTLADNRIIRRQLLTDGSRRQETFDLGPQTTAAIGKTDKPRSATLEIRSRQPPTRQPRTERYIVAVIGRLATFEQAQVSP